MTPEDACSHICRYRNIGCTVRLVNSVTSGCLCKSSVFPLQVEESMENILEVVKERDNAVSMLDTGKPSEPGGAYVRDFLGRVVWRQFKEYGVPPHVNKTHRLLYPRGFKSLHLKYLPLWREKIARRRWGRYHHQLKINAELVKQFPHLEGKLTVPLPEEPKIY